MKTVIDIQKHKNNQEIKDIADHNLRLTKSRNVNQSKTKNNKFLVGNQKTDVINELEKRLENLKFRKDAVKTVNLIFSASPEFFQNATKEKILDWEKSTQNYVNETFGLENIIYSVVHYDEKTPHFHICLVPIKDKKLNSSYWFDGPLKLKKIHTDYSNCVKHLGIKRGIQGKLKSNQTELEDYYKKVNSSTAYDKLLDKKLEDLLNNVKTPTILQVFNKSSFVNELLSPILKQLKNNLSHYRVKFQNAEKAIKENEKLKTKVNNLELKLETLGISPDISFINLNKLSSTFKSLVECQSQSKETATTVFQNDKEDMIKILKKTKPKF